MMEETESSAPPPRQDPTDFSLTITADAPLDSTITFSQLSTYPFDTDTEFQSGLATILGHPGMSATPEEISQSHDLILQAQCFYFARYDYPAPPLPSTSQHLTDTVFD